jgi:hypothetical protein
VTDVDTAAVGDALCSDHPGVVRAVRACATAAATRATADGRTDTSATRRGIEACLREAGVWTALPEVLTACVEAAGKTLRATPVAAAPYVTATATGVVLRATLDGGRLVVSCEALAIERDEGGPRLRPRDGDIEDVVRVEWRQ